MDGEITGSASWIMKKYLSFKGESVTAHGATR